MNDFYPEPIIGTTLESAPWINYCKDIKTVIIEDNVTTIGDYAFYNCTNLTNITIQNKVSIGNNAFLNTAYYNNIENWENDVLYICNHLIKANATISGSYKTKDNTVSIAEYAFSSCTNLISIDINSDVGLIDNFTFDGCTSLINITIPYGISIDAYAFNNCSSLTDVYYYCINHKGSSFFNYAGNDYFLNATEHNIGHLYNCDVVITSPTCTEVGYTTYTCDCGETSYIDNYIDATGHNYTWYTISVVTCETDGVMLGECTVCGATDVKTTLKTGHNIVDGVCQNCGYSENVENDDTNTDDNEDNNNEEVTDPSDNCSCNCHKSGISNFFFKIGLFFQKIFGSNKYCGCGVAHY